VCDIQDLPPLVVGLMACHLVITARAVRGRNDDR